MKKPVLFLFVLLAGLTACEKNVFKVDVRMNNADSTTLYLQKFENEKPVNIDSAMLINGSAILKAPLGDPQMVYGLNLKGTPSVIEFFPDNKDVTIIDKAQEPNGIEIIGSETQSKFNAFKKQSDAYYEKIETLYGKMQEAYLANDSLMMDSLNNVGDAIMKEQNEFHNNYLKEHSDDFLSHYILNKSKRNYSYEELKEFSNTFGSENPSMYLDQLYQYIEKLESIEVGHTYPDFTLPTINEGENATVSNLIAGNKYTLIDFWASWCRPCRAENPIVLAAYNQYHDKGFDVIGVSIDRDSNEWKQAVANDQLPWTQLRDVEGSVSDTYVINFIPSNFLIDSTGTIIAKGLRGENLMNKLAELLP
ncbi:MAG: redoxin domain-containing protein [Candidatus Limimorpha sp.]